MWQNRDIFRQMKAEETYSDSTTRNTKGYFSGWMKIIQDGNFNLQEGENIK